MKKETRNGMQARSAAGAAAAAPWWREAYVWLVLSGPVIVVVAGVVTTMIAYRGADPVVSRRVGVEQGGGMQPAMVARNRIGVPARGQ